MSSKIVRLLVIFVSFPAFSLDFPAKNLFRESNALVVPFSNPSDSSVVEKERFGNGWRFIVTNADSHNYMIYSHGTGYRREPYTTRARDGRGNDLYRISNWFADQNISFYAPLRKSVSYSSEVSFGEYEADIEPLESSYHVAKYIIAKDPDAIICFLGHSEGAVVPLNTATILTDVSHFRHVSISPRHGYDTGSEWSKQNFKKNKYLEARNLLITIGSKEMNDKSLTEYLSLPTDNHSIKLNILEGFDHKRVAKDSAVGDWGPLMKAGCGF
jgi:hypothetical protein